MSLICEMIDFDSDFCSGKMSQTVNIWEMGTALN